MKTCIPLLIVLLSLVACKNTHTENTKNGVSVTQITVDTLNKMSSEGNVVVIDVRTPEECAEGYLKGADKFIDYKNSTFEKQIDALDKQKTYIVYCRSGNRSSKALSKMREKGFTNLYELEGGISAVSQEEFIIK